MANTRAKPTGIYLKYNYRYDVHFEATTRTLQGDSMDGLDNYRTHIRIEHTPDGGASLFRTNIAGKPLERYLEETS